MEIAHLTWLLSAAGGGIPPVVLSLAHEQRALATSVRVLGVRDPRGRNPDATELHDALGPLALGFAPGLGAALRNPSPQLVHLHGLFTWPSRTACSWGKATHSPVIIAPHGMLDSWALANSAWKKRVFRFLVEDENLRRATCLHALCTAEVRSVRELGLRRPVVVVPNGVASTPAVSTGRDLQILERLVPGIAGRRVLLFLGRIHPKKGLLALVEAWAGVRREHAGVSDGWVLVIAGQDQLGHSRLVSRRIEELELGPHALLSGPVYSDDKDAMLRAADAFVLSSVSEGFPVAVLEAMALAIPVLVTHECNIDVEAFGGGLLTKPDVASLAAALLRMVSLSEAERRAMGFRARREVEARYTWGVVARQLMEVYRWALGGGPPPGFVCLD